MCGDRQLTAPISPGNSTAGCSVKPWPPLPPRCLCRRCQDRHGPLQFRRGCLVGNLGQELGATHDGFRDRLEATLGDWRNRLATCLEAGAAGENCAGSRLPAACRLFLGGLGGCPAGQKLVQQRPIDLFAEMFFAGLPAEDFSSPDDGPHSGERYVQALLIDKGRCRLSRRDR